MTLRKQAEPHRQGYGGQAVIEGVMIRGPRHATVVCRRPDETLTASSLIADIYEKTGRSGQMIFIVHRMEFSNPKGELVSVVDWRLVQQPDPE